MLFLTTEWSLASVNCELDGCVSSGSMEDDKSHTRCLNRGSIIWGLDVQIMEDGKARAEQ